MDAILTQIADWLKGLLIDGIMSNLSGMFDSVNQQVSDVATQVGTTPANFSPGVFGLVRNVSESVIIPIACEECLGIGDHSHCGPDPHVHRLL